MYGLGPTCRPTAIAMVHLSDHKKVELCASRSLRRGGGEEVLIARGTRHRPETFWCRLQVYPECCQARDLIGKAEGGYGRGSPPGMSSC